MKVFNTASVNPLVAEFNYRLLAAPTSQQPSTGAKNLCRRMLGQLTPLCSLGNPAFQLFDHSQQFEYGGRHFELDITWTHPNGAIDGTNASFMVGRNGSGFQFILFDQKRGTVFETWLDSSNTAAKLMPLVQMTLLYCAQRP